jgi:riboflavin kinase/FMN adenylyltransferase
MNVWNGIERFPRGTPPVVATFGNFDGVHLGHQAILDSAVAAAERMRCPAVLVTFEPHPLAIVDPPRKPRLLMTRRQKLAALEAAGLDAVLILEFGPELAALGGEEFFAGSLAGQLPLAAVHVGANFRFGRSRAGDLALLRTIGAARGFEVVGVAPVTEGGQVVSSSAIRSLVEEGDVERAQRMLGRPFALTGEVVPGEGRGRTLDFPTANLDVENEILPRRGVYVTQTIAVSLRLPSVTNVGIRPTFGGSRTIVETHLIDFEDDLYGERLEIRFLGRIRDEKRFDSPSDLADQIARDRAAAVAYFHNVLPASR